MESFAIPFSLKSCFEVRNPRKRKLNFWKEDSIKTFLQKDENKWAGVKENYHTKFGGIKALYTKTKVYQEIKKRHMGLEQALKT